MKVEEILKEIEYNTGSFPILALEKLRKEKATVTPFLLSTLEESKNNIKNLPDRYMLHIYAMFLLAEFKEPKACPIIVDFFSVPGNASLDATGDVATEYLGQILASVCNGNVKQIKGLIESRDVNEYVRSASIQSLLVLVVQGVLSRDEVINYFEELFRNKLEKEYSFVWTSLVTNSTRLCPIELKECIDTAYENGFVEPFFINQKNVDDSINSGKEKALTALRNDSRYSYIDDTVSEMRDWACFNQAKRKERKIYSSNDTKKKIKVGRNDPCPCGSGKKYKKCCYGKSFG